MLPPPGRADCPIAMARRLTVGTSWLRSAARPRRRSPRFVVRVLVASFLSVLAVLAAMSAALLVQTRTLAERDTVDDLRSAHHQLAAADAAQHRDAVLRAELIALDHELKGEATLERQRHDRAHDRARPATQQLLAQHVAVSAWLALHPDCTGAHAGSQAHVDASERLLPRQ